LHCYNCIFGPRNASGTPGGLLRRFDYMSDVNFLEFEAEIANLYAESDVVVAQADTTPYVNSCHFPAGHSVPRSEHQCVNNSFARV